jgi:hypothetical protein
MNYRTLWWFVSLCVNCCVPELGSTELPEDDDSGPPANRPSLKPNQYCPLTFLHGVIKQRPFEDSRLLLLDVPLEFAEAVITSLWFCSLAEISLCVFKLIWSFGGCKWCVGADPALFAGGGRAWILEIGFGTWSYGPRAKESKSRSAGRLLSPDCVCGGHCFGAFTLRT